MSNFAGYLLQGLSRSSYVSVLTAKKQACNVDSLRCYLSEAHIHVCNKNFRQSNACSYRLTRDQSFTGRV
jgi:hypothetical protein